MKILLKISFVFTLFLLVFSCDKKTATSDIEEKRQKIEIITDQGNILKVREQIKALCARFPVYA